MGIPAEFGADTELTLFLGGRLKADAELTGESGRPFHIGIFADSISGISSQIRVRSLRHTATLSPPSSDAPGKFRERFWRLRYNLYGTRGSL